MISLLAPTASAAYFLAAYNPFNYTAAMNLEFFDPTQDIYVHYRRLPHWEQSGAVVFITWRTVDSIPASTLRRWRVERAGWLRRHEIDPQADNWREQLSLLSPADRRDYHHHFTSAWMEKLDECLGACVLKRPELSQIVAESLLKFDGQEYVLSDFVVMPNHVHVLAQFPAEGQLKRRCRAWKHFTARRINEFLQDNGRFWQVESFDHLVRSAEQYEYLREYIRRNGPTAGLKPFEYRHYRRPE